MAILTGVNHNFLKVQVLLVLVPKRRSHHNSIRPCHMFALLFKILLIYLFCFLGPHQGHMEVPSLGVQLEQLPAYATAMATQDPSCICDLHHSSQQCRIPLPLSKARDQTHILMNTRRIRFHYTTMGTPCFSLSP